MTDTAHDVRRDVEEPWPKVAVPGGGVPAQVAAQELPSADQVGEPSPLLAGAGAEPVRPPPPPPLVCGARECRAEVRKAPVEGRVRDVLVDAEATPAGTLVWRREGGRPDGRYVLHELGKREAVDPGTRRFRAHVETCSAPAAVTKRAQAAQAAEDAAAAAVFSAAGIAVEVVPAPVHRPRPAPPVRPRPPAPPLAKVIDLNSRRPPPDPPPSRHKCMTPGHEDRPARLFPGGTFCPDCAASRESHRGR